MAIIIFEEDKEVKESISIVLASHILEVLLKYI